jgi:hypothetical protein
MGARAEEWRSQPSFLHLPPMELIALAANTKALTIEELLALEAAWHAMFGEELELTVTATRRSAAPSSVPAPASEPEPQDDDPVSGWKQAAKAAGVSVPTLRREVLAGRFPPPRRVSARLVGSPRCEGVARSARCKPTAQRAVSGAQAQRQQIDNSTSTDATTDAQTGCPCERPIGLRGAMKIAPKNRRQKESRPPRGSPTWLS